MPQITTNKQALHDYQVLDKAEAGIVLSGPEVKAVKNGQINLKGSHISIDPKSEVWLIGTHISPYKPASANQKDYRPTRDRKLLLNHKEIDQLRGKSKEKGLTILPISVYTRGSLIKVEIAVVRGKKHYDKRETIKRREIDREIRRKVRHSSR
ncbi:MAG: SsrA-binding protein SmpB [Patescibacteria group bacterium]|jgi:SsrA-binding protein|nr:SsrA-binding protein SmpB [Patescibacteria group bacterium]